MSIQYGSYNLALLNNIVDKLFYNSIINRWYKADANIQWKKWIDDVMTIDHHTQSGNVLAQYRIILTLFHTTFQDRLKFMVYYGDRVLFIVS